MLQDQLLSNAERPYLYNFVFETVLGTRMLKHKSIHACSGLDLLVGSNSQRAFVSVRSTCTAFSYARPVTEFVARVLLLLFYLQHNECDGKHAQE